MDLGFNKVAFCVLATGLMLIGLNEASHGFFPHEEHVDKSGEPVIGYKIEIVEAPTTGEAVVEGPRDYNALISAASVEAGKAVSEKCKQCHSFQGTEVVQGPPLFGVIGRPIASVAGFKYSTGATGMEGKKPGVWDYATFDHYIERPKRDVPATAMNYSGLKKQQDRSDLMAYLRTLTTGEPLPLPPPLPPQEAAAPTDAPAAPTEGAAPATTPTSAPAATPTQPAPANPT